jgi:hypothetical protein
MLYFHLMEEGEGKRKEKEKNCHGGGGFPRGWTNLDGCVVGHSC